jgi:hypothetical protein
METSAYSSAINRRAYYLWLFQSVRYWLEPAYQVGPQLNLPGGIRGQILRHAERDTYLSRENELRELLRERVVRFLNDDSLLYSDRESLGDAYIAAFSTIHYFRLDDKRRVQDGLAKATRRSYYLSRLPHRAQLNDLPFNTVNFPTFSALAELRDDPTDTSYLIPGSIGDLQSIALTLLGNAKTSTSFLHHAAIICALANRNAKVRTKAAKALVQLFPRFEIEEDTLLLKKLKLRRVRRVLERQVLSNPFARDRIFRKLQASENLALMSALLKMSPPRALVLVRNECRDLIEEFWDIKEQSLSRR